jgi:hypothetical protein
MIIQPYSSIFARKWETINDPLNGQHKLKLQFQNKMPVLIIISINIMPVLSDRGRGNGKKVSMKRAGHRGRVR